MGRSSSKPSRAPDDLATLMRAAAPLDPKLGRVSRLIINKIYPKLLYATLGSLFYQHPMKRRQKHKYWKPILEWLDNLWRRNSRSWKSLFWWSYSWECLIYFHTGVYALGNGVKTSGKFTWKKGEPLPFRAGFSQVLVVHTAAGGHEDLVHSTVTPALPTHCNNDQIKREQ